MSAIAVAGRAISIAGVKVTVPDWSDLTDWTHSWDLADAEVVGGRVRSVEDRHGGRPLRRMPGSFPLLGAQLNTYGPLPGPIYLPSSPRFNGRPALVCDPFDAEGALFHLFAGLSPNGTATTGVEDSGNYFNPPHGYPQPYWVAVLGRLGLPDDPEGGDEDAAGIWDATHGGVGTGPTIGRKIVGLGQPNWQVSNFGPGLQLVTVAHTATADETVLILCHINGASSFLEVNWRDSNGTLQTLRQIGSQLPWNYLECFVGWVHGQYLTAAGIKLGVPSESELDAVRRWASYWIPPAGELPEEP
jgi:hypothetical protein